MKNKIVGCLLAVVFLFSFVSAVPAADREVPVKNMVTMVDLGARSCIPCKMMAPILDKLEKEYDGRGAAIIFIDVWEDRGKAREFGIEAIPTQIFFDKNGKEVSRHQGFLSEEAIVAQLDKMGVPPPGTR
jgi:thioredoxin 1